MSTTRRLFKALARLALAAQITAPLAIASAAAQSIPSFAPPDIGDSATERSAVFEIFGDGPASPLGEQTEGLSLDEVAARARDYRQGAAGRPKNLAEAVYWERRALFLTFVNADLDLRSPHYQLQRLARALELAQEEAKDPSLRLKERIFVWELLAALGDGLAMCHLGSVYKDGVRKPEGAGWALLMDHRLAQDWYERAQAAGCPAAAGALAQMRE